MALQYSVALRNARADAVTAQVGANGKLRILTGAIPASCVAAETGTMLSEHTLGASLGVGAASGTLTITPPANVNATNGGTAGYWRIYKADGTTCVLQGSVGTSGADLNLNTLAIVSGGPVQVNSWTMPEGGA